MKYFLLLAGILIGCGKQEQPIAKPSPTMALTSVVANVAALPKQPKLTDKQKISMLRTEAHKRGLRWSVVCEDYESPDKQFFAYAEDKRAPEGAEYIEDGQIPWWAEDGATQADAAYRLYLSIQQPANMQPRHKEHEKHTHKVCPPRLSGD